MSSTGRMSKQPKMVVEPEFYIAETEGMDEDDHILTNINFNIGDCKDEDYDQMLDNDQ